MKITNMEVNGEKLTKVHDLKDIFIDKPDDKDPKNEPEFNKLQNIAYGGISGYIAEKSWNGFQASNTLTHEDIISELVKNGLSSERAPSAANNILDWLKQEPTRILLVVVAATGGTYALLEALSAVPGFGVSAWSRKKKVLISLLAGGIALIIYGVLRSQGYLQKTPQEPNKNSLEKTSVSITAFSETKAQLYLLPSKFLS